MWGHSIFQRADEVAADNHCLVVPFVGKTHLLHETFILVDGVVKGSE